MCWDEQKVECACGIGQTKMKRREEKRRASIWKGTHSDTVAEAGARLRASSAYVIAHAGVLACGAIQVSHGSWTARSRKSSRPRRVGACQRSRSANTEVRSEARWGQLCIELQKLRAIFACKLNKTKHSKLHKWIVMKRVCMRSTVCNRPLHYRQVSCNVFAWICALTYTLWPNLSA